MKRLFLPLVLFCGSLVTAQDIPKVTETILFKNGVLTPVPGKIDSSGAVLVKDGIIQSVGSGITIPFDARVIDLDSLYIYPGFIATASHIGVPQPKGDSKRPTIARPGYPPNDIAGITPEKSISAVYDSNDGSIENYRKQGFTVAHTFQYGKMLPGSTSIISLNGRSYNEAVIIDEYAMSLQMKGSGRMFPATEIGVMAKWRELYKNATLSARHANNYNKDPQSLKRPDSAPAVTALHDVVAGNQVIYQHAY